MLRILAPNREERRLEQLQLARRYLASVEPLVIGLGRKARVRMRLALERGKVNRDIGRILQRRGDGAASIYFSQCEYDVAYIERSARDENLPMWTVLQRIQQRKLERARGHGG